MSTELTVPKPSTYKLEIIGTDHFPVVPETTFQQGGATAVLDYIKKTVRSLDPSLDVTTDDGKALIRTTAANIRSAKARLDEIGAELKKHYLAEVEGKVNPIDPERRRIKKELEELAVATRKPLTDLEEKEEKRKADHETRLNLLALNAVTALADTSEALRQRMANLISPDPKEWEEFHGRAVETWQTVMKSLEAARVAKLQQEKDAEELAALRKREADAAQKAREDKIAADAVAAALAKQQAQEPVANTPADLGVNKYRNLAQMPIMPAAPITIEYQANDQHHMEIIAGKPEIDEFGIFPEPAAKPVPAWSHEWIERSAFLLREALKHLATNSSNAIALRNEIQKYLNSKP